MKKLLLLLLLPSTAFSYVVKEAKPYEPISFYVNDGTTVKKGMEVLATGVVNFPFGTTNAIPDASPSVSGKVNTGAQSFAGTKTFTSTPVLPAALGTGVVKSAAGALSTGAVTSAEITDGTVTGADIAAGTVTSSNITDGTVTGADIAAGTVTSSNITDGTVTGTDIADGTVASADITNSTVTGTDIANNTIMDVNISSGASIAGSKIAAASISVPGVVTIGNQSLAGDKTFAGTVILANKLLPSVYSVSLGGVVGVGTLSNVDFVILENTNISGDTYYNCLPSGTHGQIIYLTVSLNGLGVTYINHMSSCMGAATIRTSTGTTMTLPSAHLVALIYVAGANAWITMGN